jgi:hypothetical protein
LRYLVLFVAVSDRSALLLLRGRGRVYPHYDRLSPIDVSVGDETAPTDSRWAPTRYRWTPAFVNQASWNAWVRVPCTSMIPRPDVMEEIGQ